MNAIALNADQMLNDWKNWGHAPAGWYPLSLLQRGIWRSNQLEPESRGSNNLAFCATVFGQIDSLRLAKALDTLAARHPILRVCIKEHRGEPGQFVKSRISVPLASLDATNLDPSEFEELLRKECVRPFDLATAPLMRASLYHRNADESVLLLVLDRLIIDSWSFRRLIRELGELLDGSGDCLRLALDKASDESTYLDYVYWEQEWIDSDQAVEQLAYWRMALREEYPRLNLYGGEVPKQDGRAERDSVSFLLPKELVRGLRGLADSNGATLHTVLLAGYLICLRRLTGEARIAVGAPMPARAGGEWDSTIGNFENLVAIGAEFHPELTVRDLLWTVGGTLARAGQNQAYPFGELVRRLNPVHADQPYFQTLFALHQPYSELEVLGLAGSGSDGCAVSWGGLDLKPHFLAFRSGGSDFALALDVVEAGETLSGTFTFATASFERGTIARYCSYWRTLLEGLVADDGALVDRLPLLTEGERRRILIDWNATAADYPQDRGIHQLFEDQAARTPDAIAVVHGDRQLSYAELNAAANRLAHHLRALGVGPKGYVATMLERSIDLVVAELAVLKCGAAYVPIDPTFPADRQAFMLADCGAEVVLTSGDMAVPDGSAVRRVDVDAPLPEGPGDNLEVQADGAAAAYVMYTSGSTGQPKGVVVPHRGIGRLVLNNGYAAFDAGDRVAFAANPAFDATTLEVWAPLLNGGSIVVIDQGVFLEPARLAAFLREYEVTALFITTALFNHYAATRPDAFAGLRFLLTGGERADPASFAQILRMGPPQHLIHCYGPTETTTFAITHDIGDVAEGARSIPLGRPIANTQIYILDRYGEPVPVGVAGEIHIGGSGVARGYLNRPELSAERFLRDPFSAEPGARMYKTGDLGRWLADSTIEFLGRNDFQVKLRGFRIELGEIEAQLASYPSVREAVVLAREDRPGDRRLVAYYTGEESIAAERLRSYLGERLPEYMVPAAYVRLEALPLTPNGKLDRQALPAPEGDAYGVRDYEAPVGEAETTLARIWAEVLKVERVGRQDHFFELGGHSLLAVQLASRLKEIGIEIPLTVVFTHPTFESFSSYVTRENREESDSSIVPFRTEGSEYPLFLIHEVSGEMLYGAYLTDYIDASIPVYGLAGETLDEACLETAQALAARLVPLIRSVQPAGPYRIAGWSFGGTLAYAIAAQLVGEDETVEFLGLLDTYHFGKTHAVPKALQDDKEFLLELAGSYPELQPVIDELRSLASSSEYATFIRKCQELSLLPKELSPDEVRQYLTRWKTYQQAAMQFVAEPIPVPVHLFVARDENTTNPLRGWGSVLPEKQISTISVPGTHQSMMESEHIVAVGEALTRAILQIPERPIRVAELDYSPLLTIQSGRRGQIPVLCVPGAGGSITGFAELVGSLGAQLPVLGLQPRGLDGVLVPHATVPAAAKAYVRAIREIYSKGELHLLGHSFGGWVAFEMARQLTEQGYAITSLTLLDSEVPDSDDRISRDYSDIAALMKLLEIFEQVAECSLGIREEELQSLDANGRLALLHERLVRVGIMPRRSEPAALRGPVRTFASALRAHYRPTASYTGPVRLVVVGDNTDGGKGNSRIRDEAIDGWTRWAPNLAECWCAPGNHMTLLKHPHVEVLGQWYREGLQGR